MSQAARQHYSFGEYVELEAMSPVKHEFLRGEVWAMAGGSPDHAAIAGNIIAQLSNQLRSARCRVFTSDLRIRVLATGLGTYPDVSVVCGQLELDPDDPRHQTVTNPKVLFEVVSDSTEKYDRGEKLDQYRKSTLSKKLSWSLKPSDESMCGVVTRELGPSSSFVAKSRSSYFRIECELPLSEIYRDPLA